MRPVVTVAQMRAAEEDFFAAHPGADLMGRAAEEVARLATRIAPEGAVLVVAGPGDNGGDGLFAAARLAAGRRVLVWLAMGRGHEAGLAAARAAGCLEVDAVAATGAVGEVAVVIDAVTGLGSRPGLPAAVATLAEAADAVGLPVLSVDLPSGLDADDGALHPSIRATHTVTFGAVKACHVQQPAAARCGVVHLAGIGIEPPRTELRQAEESDLARWWPVPDETSEKYSRGVVALDVGSPQYPGAALLGCLGAVHAGAGMVRYTGAVAAPLILGALPSIVVGEGRAQAMVLGSGWGETAEGASRLEAALSRRLPVLVDADALRCLPAGRLDGWLLTPHAGELARLLGCTRGPVESEPITCARELARRTGATVLLKGATQYVAEPSGRVTIAVPGPAWTAQAGSGDVLAGICGALLAAGLPAWRAGVVGASIQALTARRNPGPYPPDELARRLPAVIADLVRPGGEAGVPGA